MDVTAILAALKLMKHSPVYNYATAGLTSSLIGGADHGKVRLFMSDRDTREWVTPHSHRFNFTCLVLAGSVENILFTRASYLNQPGANAYVMGTVRPSNGGLGGYELSRGSTPEAWIEESATYGVKDTYSMTSKQIHSIRFSRGAIVLFLEGPELVDNSMILEPWSNDRVVPTFESRSWMFERPALTEGEPR